MKSFSIQNIIMKVVLKIIACFFLLSSCNQVLCQYKSTNGPEEGYIFQVYNEGQATFVLTENGLFRTEDNGDHYERCEFGVPFYEAIGLAVDGDELFLSYITIWGKQTGFVYSQDRGKTWVQRPLYTKGWYSYDVAYQDGILVSCTQTGELIESLDKGLTWRIISFQSINQNVELVRNNSSYFYVAIDNHSLYRRAIHAQMWELVYESKSNFYDLHVSDSIIILLADRVDGQVSHDDGGSWKVIGINGYNSDYKIADFGDILYYLSSDDLFKSTDKGNTWNLVKNLNSSYDFTDAVRIGNNLMGIEYSMGLVKTNDEFSSFKQASNGINAAWIYSASLRDSFIYTHTDHNVYKFNVRNKKWIPSSILQVSSMEGFVIDKENSYILTGNGDSIIVLDRNDKIIKSSKLDWRSSDNSGHNIGFTYSYLNSIILFINGRSIFSKDSGNHWTPFGLPFIKTPFDNIISMVNYHDSLLIAGFDANSNVSFAISKDLQSWMPFNIQNNEILNEKQFMMISDGEIILFKFFNFESNFCKYNPSKHSLSKCKGIDYMDISFERNSKLIKFGDKKYLLNCTGGKFITEDDGENWYLFIDQFYLESSNSFNDVLFIDSNFYFASNYIGLLELPLKEIKGSKINTNVYYDSNQNLVRDNQDKGLKGTFLKLKENGNYILSNSNGEADLFYSISTPDTFEVIHHFKYGNFTPASVAIDTNLKAYNFAYQIPSGINDVSIQMYAGRRARPGFNFSLYLVIQNHGSTNWAGVLNLQYDKIFQFLDCSDILSKQSLGLLSWDIDTLSTLETKMIQVNFNLTANIPLGTIYTHTAELSNNLISDIDLTDNKAVISYEVVGSCDPNEMEVDKDAISKKEFSEGSTLNYKVRFQNTGNFPAEFVTVKINIYNFDPESIHIISASHEYEYSLDASGYELTVRFDMIQLLDSSSNESKSHGFIHFSASPKKSLTYLKQIDCSASIYFDYNTSVPTNTATTLIKDLTLTKDLTSKETYTQVFPNPNEGSFFVSTKEKFSFRILSIYDITGKIVFVKKFNKTINSCNIKLDNLMSGTYSIKLEGDGIQFSKFVVVD